jgi:Skp family chaperone for outer membrane proteins
MRGFRRLLLAALLLVAATATAGKIGFVDAERAVATVKQGQAKLKELDEWARPERERIEGLRTRVTDLRTRISQQGDVASADSLQSLRDQELQARRAYEDARREFERQLDQKQNELLGDVAVKVGTVASDYGRANDYDAIFVLKAQPLIYVADSADLTDLVIRLYDERYPLKSE